MSLSIVQENYFFFKNVCIYLSEKTESKKYLKISFQK